MCGAHVLHGSGFAGRGCALRGPLAYLDHQLSLLSTQELRYCEFFAGDANAYRAIQAGGFPACAIDIRYLEGLDLGTNPFDILTPSGLACNTQTR